MTEYDVLELKRAVNEAGADFWIDGGWGVDALLGEQTRPHADLDIALEGKDEQVIKQVFTTMGFKDVPRDDTRPWNYVLGDDKGRQLDFHIVNLDANGNGIYGPPENGQMYPAAAFTGEGKIGGQKVKCISPKVMVSFHSGYTLKEKDYHDVKALCDKFGIPLPEEYTRFEAK